MEVEFVSDGGIVEISEDVIRGDVEDEAVGVCVEQCGAGESELEGAEDVLHADLGVLQDGDPYVDGLIEQDGGASEGVPDQALVEDLTVFVAVIGGESVHGVCVMSEGVVGLVAGVLHGFTEVGVVGELEEVCEHVVSVGLGLVAALDVLVDVRDEPGGLVEGDGTMDAVDLPAAGGEEVEHGEGADVLFDGEEMVKQAMAGDRGLGGGGVGVRNSRGGSGRCLQGRGTELRPGGIGGAGAYRPGGGSRLDQWVWPA